MGSLPEQNLNWIFQPMHGGTGYENYKLISLVQSQRDKLALIYYEAII